MVEVKAVHVQIPKTNHIVVLIDYMYIGITHDVD
jgi:hypothetical protein